MSLSNNKYQASNIKFGFTLVEILVAISILATIAGGAYVALNPATQLNKARDAVSLQGLQEIKTALDSYYADTNCYPRVDSVFASALASGGEWKNDFTGTVYLTKMPLDGYGEPFIYLTEPQSDACPQWYSLFSRMRVSPEADVCPLDNSVDEACVPAGFDERWACVTGGITNCALLAESQVVGNTVSLPTPTPLPSGAPTPTPAGTESFTISMSSNLLPRFYNGSISSKTPKPGEEFTINIDNYNESGYVNPNNVVSVNAIVRSDNATNTYPLTLKSGTATLGGWGRTWTQSDTVNHTFIITFEFVDSAGNESGVDVVIR